MAPQILLVTPIDADPATLPGLIAPLVAAEAVTALLVRRGARDDAAYGALVSAVLPVAQGADTAVLVEDDAELAFALGADGVHVTGGAKDVAAAVARVKPDLIVGAGPVWTRHAAMTFGEAGIDYLHFGAIGETAAPDAKELAEWWAEAFEIPAVLAAAPGDDALGCEFLGLGDALWQAPEGPAAALARALPEPVA
jgi:thiamine-phosphate pyrophosphorylase